MRLFNLGTKIAPSILMDVTASTKKDSKRDYLQLVYITLFTFLMLSTVLNDSINEDESRFKIVLISKQPLHDSFLCRLERILPISVENNYSMNRIKYTFNAVSV
jgi:hypothetical protein